MAGAVFGAWAKRTQLTLFSPGLPAFYPHSYWLCSIAIILLAFVVSWLAWGAAVKAMIDPDELSLWMSAHTLAYWVLAACAWGCPFTLSLRLFLALYVILPAVPAFRHSRHALAFLLILAAQAAANKIVSPLSWKNPVAALAKNESIQLGANTPLYPENYAGAKAFDLSGFTQSYWGCAPAAPMASYSYGTAFLTWLLDPPIIDVTAFFGTVQKLFFFWCALGAFGFYLFILKGIRLSYATALAGGLLMLPCNPFLGAMLKDYFPLFTGVILTLPWALLFLSIAARRNSAPMAFAAGLTFCLNFYILPSHPDMVIGGLAVLWAYAVYFCGRDSPGVLGGLLMGLAGGACHYGLPIIEAVLHHQLGVFGHLDHAFRPAPTGLGAASMFAATRGMRVRAFLAFFLLAPALYALEALLGLRETKRSRAGAAACALLTAALIWAGGRNYIGAPKDQQPYILLQTLITNYRNLRRPDQASLRLLQERSAGRPPREIDDHHALEAASHPLETNAYTPLDSAYVYKPDFNLPAVLAGIGGRFQRILAATPNDNSHVGAVTGGLFLNNASTAVDSRFISVYPTLQAIYLLPGEYFKNVGNYDAPNPWNITMEMALQPLARKLFNIAGIDVYIFGKYQFESLRDTTDLRRIPYEIPAPLDPHLATVTDERSYGMAYLARDVRYAAPFAPAGRFSPPFDPAKPKVFEDYVKSVKELQARLMALPRLHSILLEDSKLAGREVDIKTGNRMTIDNIAGNKASFNVHCQASPCVLVFNTADVAGWKAFAEDRPLEIKRANYAFLSVEVPEGNHSVWFEHRTPGSLIGAVVTLFCYAAGLLALLLG